MGALLLGAPVLTLVATGYNMMRDGGLDLRPRAVTVAAAEPGVAAPTVQPPAAVTPGGGAVAPLPPTAPATPGSAAGNVATAQGAGAAGASDRPAGGDASRTVETTPSSGATAPTQAPGASAVAGVDPARSDNTTLPRRATDFSGANAAWQTWVKEGDAKQGEQVAQAGRPAQGIQACVACHGAQGIAPAGGIFPNLAGFSADYIAKQLSDYRAEARINPIMVPIAKALTEQDIGALAQYYGSLDAPAVRPPSNPAQAALKLDTLGENERALPACANCHGMTGRGEGPLLPRLAGQSKGYFVEQMNAFRSDQRHNDDVGVMRAFAKRLTPEEIDALGDYYANAVAK